MMIVKFGGGNKQCRKHWKPSKNTSPSLTNTSKNTNPQKSQRDTRQAVPCPQQNGTPKMDMSH